MALKSAKGRQSARASATVYPGFDGIRDVPGVVRAMFFNILDLCWACGVYHIHRDSVAGTVALGGLAWSEQGLWVAVV